MGLDADGAIDDVQAGHDRGNLGDGCDGSASGRRERNRDVVVCDAGSARELGDE